MVVVDPNVRRRFEDLPANRRLSRCWIRDLGVSRGIRDDEWYRPRGGGDEETRTPDPLLAKEMLCQLSYVPVDTQSAGSGGRTWTRTRDLGLIRAAL
jgi:hypothetical protein